MNIKESKPFFLHKEEPVYNAGEGIRRQFLAYNQNIMAVKVFFNNGAIGAMHTHPHTQVTYIVSGTFDIIVENETKRLNSGDASYIKPDLNHGCICIEEGILIEVFTPLREDLYSTIQV